MLLTARQLLVLIDLGVCLNRLNQYLKGAPEVYDGEHEEIATALRKVGGKNWKDYVEYAKLNSVKYGIQ